MRSKKIISLLCAVSMGAITAASAIPAIAADDIYSFDGSSNSGWSELAAGSIKVENDDKGDYLTIQGSGSGNRTTSYTLPEAVSGEYVIEFDTLMARGNGMGRIMHSTQIAFTNDNTVESNGDTRDGSNIVDEVNAELSSSYKSNAGSSLANAALKIDLRPYMTNQWMINDDSDSELVAFPETAVTVTDNTWVRVQAAVKDNTTTVNIIDNAGNKIVENVAYTNKANEIKYIYVVSNRGDSGSGLIALDNIHIYQGAPEALTTDGLRGESTIATPEPPATLPPTPAVKEAAPVFTAHETAEKLYTQDFSASAVGDGISQKDSAQEAYTGIEGLTMTVGSRNNDTQTSALVDKYADNVLTISGGEFSTNGRGAVVSLTDNLSIAEDNTKTSIMAFAFDARALKDGGSGRLYLLDNNTNTDDNGASRDILAVFTTAGDGANYANGDTKIGVDVDYAGWNTVAVAVSADKYRVYLNGDYDNPVVQGTKVGVGATSVSVTHLPMLAVTNGKSTSWSTVMVDNIMAYQISASFEKKYLPTISEPEPPEVVKPNLTFSDDLMTVTSDIASDDVVIIKASYENGRLKSVESIKTVVEGENALTWANAPVEGDKVIALSSISDIEPLLEEAAGLTTAAE